MVRVQVSDENLVEKVIRDLEGRNPFGGPGADVEEELVAVAKLDEKAGRCLGRAGRGHPGAAGDNPHLIRR